ncbi:MAG TPA: type III polyketide synthase [Tepidisphaeraceae bacterium]|jgi:predicted naringenin-chalcone synthase|nr:type III polyketide synthase [Tepidisphaeraceae bacterium]
MSSATVDRPPVIGLLSIGLATPRSIAQTESAAMGERLSCDEEQQRSWLRRVFSRAGAVNRGSVLQQSDDPNDGRSIAEFYPPRAEPTDRGPGTAQRMNRYAIEAPQLAHRAAGDALADAAVPPERVTHLITVSCTGFTAPGLDVELIERLALRPSVSRLHVGFMGCHAALNALGAARAIALADADAVVLVCCVELCSLHFAYGWSPDRVVANSLFADGAAAAVVANVDRVGRPHLWQLDAVASLLVPGSREAMTWRIGDHGFEMTLSAQVPEMIERHLRPWCQEWLGSNGVRIADVDQWAVHPGGPRILTAAGTALELPDDALQRSRDILAARGNMSSATVLFILRQMADENAHGRCVAMGFGPGLMLEGVLLYR